MCVVFENAFGMHRARSLSACIPNAFSCIFMHFFALSSLTFRPAPFRFNSSIPNAFGIHLKRRLEWRNQDNPAYAQLVEIHLKRPDRGQGFAVRLAAIDIIEKTLKDSLKKGALRSLEKRLSRKTLRNEELEAERLLAELKAL